ncbi:hypothetical protein ACHAXA_004597 [Cyclostephanos tholiformis]|uniref:Uncharacterized protein n=1 Tax=Cyclostephanos tholiformis TaxID=382380 RepID=A0ABD3SNW5_9STRA
MMMIRPHRSSIHACITAALAIVASSAFSTEPSTVRRTIPAPRSHADGGRSSSSIVVPAPSVASSTSSSSSPPPNVRYVAIDDHSTAPLSHSSSFPSRRACLLSLIPTIVACSSATASVALPRPSFAADAAGTAAIESLLSDLDESLGRLRDIPPLLESSQWDKVRTILKTPPVNKLWNMASGDAQNTLSKLAMETGEMGLLEIRDELAISLQMTDQYSYDNNFIYYQPGNGKVKVKEPMEMANKAIAQLGEAIEFAKSIR